MGYLGTPIDTNNTFQSLQGKRFSGNGSTTAFTLDVAPTSTFDIEVFVENVRQDPNSAYSLSGTTLTFAAAPGSGTNNIYVIHQAKAVATISAGAGTVNADSMDNTVISGHDALAAEPADTDEFLVSDAGTIKRIDYSLIKATNTPAFFVTKSGNQNVATGTGTVITWDVESYDTANAFASNAFTVPSGQGGKYFIYCSLNVSGGSANNYLMNEIMVNDTLTQYAISRFAGAGGLNGNINVSLNLSEGDVVNIKALHNTGSTEVIDYDKLTWFGGFKIIGA